MYSNHWDHHFLELAQKISTKSKDPSTKCGAVIVDSDNSIVSTGYNGFPKKIADKPEDLNNREVKYRKVIHCEMNAVRFAGRKSLAGCTLYTYPFMCCSRCAAHIVAWEISRHVAPEVPEDKKARWEEDMGYAKEMFNEGGVAVALYKQKQTTYVNPEDGSEFIDDITFENLPLCSHCGCGVHLSDPYGPWVNAYSCEKCYFGNRK